MTTQSNDKTEQKTIIKRTIVVNKEGYIKCSNCGDKHLKGQICPKIIKEQQSSEL